MSTVSTRRNFLLFGANDAHVFTDLSKDSAQRGDYLVDNVQIGFSKYDCFPRDRVVDLQVRVAGWNIRWNDIPKKEQDEYIRRAESLQ